MHFIRCGMCHIGPPTLFRVKIYLIGFRPRLWAKAGLWFYWKWCTTLSFLIFIFLFFLYQHFQIISGILLIVEHNLDEWKDKNRFLTCRRINMTIACFMFVIIVINILVVAFGDPENLPNPYWMSQFCSMLILEIN